MQQVELSPGGHELEERVIRIDRVRKTVKGGRIPSSRAVCAVGDGHGHVGLGVAKARQAPDAIRKAIDRARKALIRVPLDGYTIPHAVTAKTGGAVIFLKPASRGTGVIAGGSVRAVVELAGIRDILSKSLGSQNVLNRAKATFEALRQLHNPRLVSQARGKALREMLGRDLSDPYDTAAESVEGVEEAEEEPEDDSDE
jgi:small subunit ribosomal protein S5